jgi:Male sterility protein
MGKVFLEHLLRFTQVDKIFLLVREKKNKMPSERVKEIFQNVVSVLKKILVKI